MAKHPVPKKKTSKSRSKKRYGSFKTKVLRRLSDTVKLTNCPQCGAKRLMHTVCPECGQYRGRQVLSTAAKTTKVTKIKA